MKHSHSTTLFFCLLLSAFPAIAYAFSTISLSVDRPVVLADGKSSAVISATVRDSSGNYVPDGIEVDFHTTLGTLEPLTQAGNTGAISDVQATTMGGVARVRITSNQTGDAQILVTSPGAGAATIRIRFTNSTQDTYQGNAFVAVRSNHELMYSVTDRTIEASSPHSGAYLSFRNIQVYADQIQLDCNQTIVRARGGVRLKVADHTISTDRLYYNLMTNDGYAVVAKGRALRPVQLKGESMKQTLMPGGIPPIYLKMADLSDSNLVIAARQILFFPNDKLQFTSPRFYQQGQMLVSMPYYVLSLGSNHLFSEQFVSLGSQGIGVDIPFYFQLSPSKTGIFYLRRGDQRQSSIYTTQAGWSLDMVQKYSSLRGERYQGQFGINGITRSDWGVDWSHSEQFSPTSVGSIYLDFPQHRNLFLTSNYNDQIGTYRLGANVIMNQSLNGIPINNQQGTVYFEGLPRPMGKTGYFYTIGTSSNISRTAEAGIRQDIFTQSISMRANSSPFKLDHDTTLTHSFSIGEVMASGASGGTSLLSSLSLTHTFGATANLQLSYDFTHQPYTIYGEGQHRISASFFASGRNKWYLTLYASDMLDAPNSSLLSDFSYSIAPKWRVALMTTMQQYGAATYKDFDLGLAYDIGGRDVILSWSSLEHRISLRLGAAQF